MAQNDIIDIDAILDDYEAGLLTQAATKQASQQSAADLDAQMLSSQGYVEPEVNYNPSPFSSVRDYLTKKKEKDAAVKRGILADDPYFVENYLPDADAQTRAEYTGVDFTGGAEGDVIRQISLLPSDVGSDLNSITRVIQKNYAKDHNIPRTYDYNVRVEPNTNELIFNDPLNKNQPTIINPPGIDKGEMLAFAEPLAAEISAGVVGGIVGSAGGPIGTGAGALTAETLATYVWRLNNLNYLDEQGYLPENYDINGRAMKDAGMTALFSLGGMGVFKLAKMAYGVSSPGKSFPLNEDEFIASYQKVFGEQSPDSETAALIASDTAMTSPQVMLAASERGVDVPRSQVEGSEQALRSEAQKDSSAGEELRKVYAEQERLAMNQAQTPFTDQNITRDLVEEETGAGARSLRGEEIRQVAEETLDINPRMMEAERELTDLSLKSDQIFNELTENSIDPVAAGQAIRSGFQQAKESAATAVDEAYDEAAEAAGFKGNIKPYDYRLLVKPITKMSNMVKQQAFPDIKDAKRLQGVLKSIETGSMKPHSVFVQDLSELRSIIRQQRALGKNVDDLVIIKDSMLSIRKKALKEKGGANASAKFETAENAYRQLNEEFNNKTIKNMLKVQNVSANKYAQGDKQAYEGFVNFLRSNITEGEDGRLTSPDFINKVLLDPENTNGLLGLKAGLRREFFDKVVTEQGGVLKPKSANAYKTFMDKNRNVINKFFTQDEINQFDSAASFIKTFKSEQLALTKTRDKLAKSTNLAPIAANLNKPETIFKDTWRPGEISSTKELFDAVTTNGNQELIDSYKAYIFKDFMDATQVKGTLNQKVFNASKMENYLDNHGDAMEIWFGKKFRSQLTDITEKLKPYDNVGAADLADSDAFILNSLNSLARAYVGLFTTPGRVLTAVKTIYGGNAQRKQLKLLADPDKLYEVIMQDKWQKNPGVRGAVRELGRLYYREEFDQPEFKSETTPMESVLFGPGYQQKLNKGGHVIKNLGVPLKYGYGE